MEVGNEEKTSEMAMKVKKLEWRNKILKNANRLLKMRLKTKVKCENCTLFSKERNLLVNKNEVHELHIEMLEKKYVEKLCKLHEAQLEITKLNKTISQLQQQISCGKNGFQVNQLGNFIKENNVQETINMPGISGLFQRTTVNGERSRNESFANVQIKKEPLEDINLYEICRNATDDHPEDVDSGDRNGDHGAFEECENTHWPNGDLELLNNGSTSNILTCKWIRHDGAVCGRVFASVGELAAHFRAAHTNAPDEHGYVCRWQGCRRAGVPIKSKHYFLIHFRYHSGERPFRCSREGCGMTFADRSTLRTHDFTHNRQMFPCAEPSCSKVFTHKHNMVEHYRVRHEGNETFKCTVPGCGKLSQSAYSQRVHMRVHSRKGAYPYPCLFPACKKSFVHESNRDKHLVTHMPNKCFECPFEGCGMTFTSNAEFQRHACRQNTTELVITRVE